ncbi:MAG: hypothetical protein ACTSPY_08025 [Candidatus Helarchaeota archaeon]
MVNDKELNIEIEIIKSNSKKKNSFYPNIKEKRSVIQFKCPICQEIIVFKCEIPEGITIFPYRIEFDHNGHILLIDLDNNHDIREIKPKK